MRNKKTSAALVVVLSILMVAMYLAGFLLKQQVFRDRELYRDTPIPALPYIFLFDSAFHDQLAAERLQAELPETAPPESEPDESGDVSETEPPAAETESPGETEPDESGDVAETEPPVAEPLPTYVKGTVGTDYFDDALFIGDSRTDGLYLYSRYEGADYFSGKGMTIYSIFDKANRDGVTMLKDMLSAKEYRKVYIMLGINELGGNLELLAKQYAMVVNQLKELAPDAVIVIQGNLSIDKKTSATSAWYLTAERIHELNLLLAAIADEERVFYLDPNEIFCDEEGFLKAGLSGDGVHLYAKHYADWTAWLCENAYVATETE